MTTILLVDDEARMLDLTELYFVAKRIYMYKI